MFISPQEVLQNEEEKEVLVNKLNQHLTLLEQEERKFRNSSLGPAHSTEVGLYESLQVYALCV